MWVSAHGETTPIFHHSCILRADVIFVRIACWLGICRMSLRVTCCLVGLMLVWAGCSKPAPLGGEREKTSPVKGIVKIDGQPADALEVIFYPQNADAKVKYPISTMTDKDGKFSVTTYEAQDGLPAGEYKLTFIWMEQFLNGKDRLRGKMKDQTKSNHSVSVKGTEAEVVDMGTIELKTK